jgi:hypothetical protein
MADATVTWYFAIVTFPSHIDPTMTAWTFNVSRQATGEAPQTHGVYAFDQDPLWTDPQLEILGVEFTETTFHKWGRLSFLDTVTGERVFYDWDISVPPFNGNFYSGSVFHNQTHGIAPPPPQPQPPPVQPPPVPIGPPAGPPIEVILEPPDDRPRPVDLPPPVEPPEPIDWRPGPLPPDIIPPPRTRDTDIFTLRQFAAKWGHQIDRYALNVPLDGGEVVEDLPEPYRSFWQRLTTHKADIVFERKGIVYVAEIKPRLSRGAIGEAITAHELFKRLYRFPLETRAAVICQTAHPTLIQTASWLDVLVYVTEQVDTGQPAGLYRRIGR